jgi:hypothetical protein
MVLGDLGNGGSADQMASCLSFWINKWQARNASLHLNTHTEKSKNRELGSLASGQRCAWER